MENRKVFEFTVSESHKTMFERIVNTAKDINMATLYQESVRGQIADVNYVSVNARVATEYNHRGSKSTYFNEHFFVNIGDQLTVSYAYKYDNKRSHPCGCSQYKGRIPVLDEFGDVYDFHFMSAMSEALTLQYISNAKSIFQINEFSLNDLMFRIYMMITQGQNLPLIKDPCSFCMYSHYKDMSSRYIFDGGLISVLVIDKVKGGESHTCGRGYEMFYPSRMSMHVAVPNGGVKVVVVERYYDYDVHALISDDLDRMSKHVSSLLSEHLGMDVRCYYHLPQFPRHLHFHMYFGTVRIGDDTSDYVPELPSLLADIMVNITGGKSRPCEVYLPLSKRGTHMYALQVLAMITADRDAIPEDVNAMLKSFVSDYTGRFSSDQFMELLLEHGYCVESRGAKVRVQRKKDGPFIDFHVESGAYFPNLKWARGVVAVWEKVKHEVYKTYMRASMSRFIAICITLIQSMPSDLISKIEQFAAIGKILVSDGIRRQAVSKDPVFSQYYVVGELNFTKKKVSRVMSQSLKLDMIGSGVTYGFTNMAAPIQEVQSVLSRSAILPGNGKMPIQRDLVISLDLASQLAGYMTVDIFGPLTARGVNVYFGGPIVKGVKYVVCIPTPSLMALYMAVPQERRIPLYSEQNVKAQMRANGYVVNIQLSGVFGLEGAQSLQRHVFRKIKFVANVPSTPVHLDVQLNGIWAAYVERFARDALSYCAMVVYAMNERVLRQHLANLNFGGNMLIIFSHPCDEVWSEVAFLNRMFKAIRIWGGVRGHIYCAAMFFRRLVPTCHDLFTNDSHLPPTPIEAPKPVAADTVSLDFQCTRRLSAPVGFKDGLRVQCVNTIIDKLGYDRCQIILVGPKGYGSCVQLCDQIYKVTHYLTEDEVPKAYRDTPSKIVPAYDMVLSFDPESWMDLGARVIAVSLLNDPADAERHRDMLAQVATAHIPSFMATMDASDMLAVEQIQADESIVVSIDAHHMDVDYSFFDLLFETNAGMFKYIAGPSAFSQRYARYLNQSASHGVEFTTHVKPGTLCILDKRDLTRQTLFYTGRWYLYADFEMRHNPREYPSGRDTKVMSFCGIPCFDDAFIDLAVVFMRLKISYHAITDVMYGIGKEIFERYLEYHVDGKDILFLASFMNLSEYKAKYVITESYVDLGENGYKKMYVSQNTLILWVR
jgi:hypothetical protein